MHGNSNIKLHLFIDAIYMIVVGY